MRVLFWLILLANVMLFILIQQGWSWGERPVYSKPGLNEDKVRVLDAGPKTVPTVLQSTPPSLDLRLSLNASASDTVAVNKPTCLEWGEFSGAELKRATVVMSDMKLGKKLDSRQVDQVIRYWVYMPPQKTKAGVDRKIAQLKERGIEEYFVVQENGSWKNAISLGVFKSQEAAESFLKYLRTKDVRTARVGARTSMQKATTFIMSSVDDATMAKLNTLNTDFPGSELKSVPCAH